MLKSIFKRLNHFKLSDKENIKEVLEDLIEDDVNGSNNIDAEPEIFLKNVINLSDKCIEDIMIPRADIDAISADTSYNELANFVEKQNILEYQF